jgi:two-component system, NarL family, sensor kinase
MTGEEPRRLALSLALLRAALLAVILVCEQLVDARQLTDTWFFVVLYVAAGYAAGGIFYAWCVTAAPAGRAFSRLAPAADVLLLAGLAATSGGAFSDVRKAFFVIPLVAAFSERPREAAKWSLAAVLAFSLQAALTGGHPHGVLNTWPRVMLGQDLYLAWTGVAGTILAAALARRSARTEELAGARQRLVTHAIESVERERTRLADALHDSAVQNLIAARHDLRRAERTGDVDSFARLSDAIDDTVMALREEIFKLHPHVLDHVGLSAALEQVARRHERDADIRVMLDIDPEAAGAHGDFLFALGRELLGNAAKHAQPHEIRMALSRDRARVTMDVADDGCGIPDGRLRQALLDGHVGLAAVRERVAALGGTLSIDSAAGRGTAVRVSLPAH